MSAPTSTMNTKQAAQLLGVSVDALYDATARGTAPIAPIRVGRILRWPTAKLHELLGIGDDDA